MRFLQKWRDAKVSELKRAVKRLRGEKQKLQDSLDDSAAEVAGLKASLLEAELETSEMERLYRKQLVETEKLEDKVAVLEDRNEFLSDANAHNKAHLNMLTGALAPMEPISEEEQEMLNGRFHAG